MAKSLKKNNDDSYEGNLSDIRFKFLKLLYPIKFLITKLFNKRTEDDFFSAIKQLKTNRRKMSLDERNILTNLIKLEGKTVEDIMVPRSDIAAIKLSTNIEELNKMIKTQLPHTRTLVYDSNLDNMVGFIHIKDLFKALITKQDFQVKRLIRKHIIAAPSMKLIDLLAKMRRECTHIAIVVDEYGGTDGMVTIEDIMEAIVGRIDDEHDKQLDSDNLEILNDHTIISNARVEVEVLEEIIKEKLKNNDDEFDTIGGLVLTKVGKVPAIGSKIDISSNIEIEITKASPRTLKQVKIRLKNGLSAKN